MATVAKDFKIKSGLIVEGTTATVNNQDILTKKQADQDYIVNLIGGTSTPDNTPDTVVKRDSNGNFAAGQITADLIGDVDGNAETVTSLSGHTTDEVSEGTSNQYFTSQRALDATSSAYDAAGAAQTAQDNAESFATTAANNAESNAISSAALDATNKANTAEDNAKSFATSADTTLYGTVTSDIATAKSEAISSANGYTDTAVAGLVDSAPELLNTLNELAAALGDSPDTITNLTTSIGEKLPLAGGTLTGELLLAADPTQSLAAATKAYVDDSATSTYNDAIATADGNAQNYANTAENNAESYADSLAVNYDAAGAASTAQSNAETFATNAINALTTSDIEEGSVNLYFTDQRAIDAVGLSITNAINALDTTDIEEGENLYFTDERAIDAVSAADIYPNAVILNNVSKQVATQITAETAGVQIGNYFDKTAYRSAEFLVKVAYGTHTEVSKVLLTLDTSDNIAITEYGVVGTNGSASSISADISGTNVRLLVTTTNNNSTVTVVGTLLI